jgi:septal ring factor EnvC (AmiA/AmiB activator)
MAATRALEMRVQGTLAPRRAQAEQALRQIQNDPRATEAQRALAQARLRSLDAEINAVTAEIDRLAAPTAQADRLLTRCRSWIVQAQAAPQ